MITRPPTEAHRRDGAALLAPQSNAAPQHRMKLAKFTPVTTGGSLLAYLDVEMSSGLIVRDCRLMRTNGTLWIAPPSQKQVDRDGEPILDERGKPRYRNFVDFRDRSTRDRFSSAVINAIRREHPDALEPR